MASELRVDKIIPTSGVPATGGGGVVQVVHGTKTGEVTITSTSFQDTGVTATITPKFNTSKILVQTTQPLLYRTNTAQGFRTFLLRGSTIITMHETYASGGDEWKFASHNMLYLDSPATTNAITYKTQGQSPSDGSTRLLYNYNWQIDSTSIGNLTGYGTRSSMILMEVSA